MPASTTTISALITLSLLTLARASCQLTNQLTAPFPSPGPQFCQPTGAGVYTFSMQVSEIEVPTFDSGNPDAGNVAASAFVIYDNTCTAVGSYSPDQDNNCGSPYVIEENFLQYVLTVQNVNFNAAGPYFEFVYANGKYSINNNHCGCAEVPHALQVEQGCKCAFPVAGETKKRSVAFEA